MSEKVGSKEKILETVVELLSSGKDPTQFSNKEIAEMAGVNAALINYYYQSKDNLIGIAAGICIQNIIGAIQEVREPLPPQDKIKVVLKRFAVFCLENTMVVEIAINYNEKLKRGNTHTSRMLLPLLKEHFGESKFESELKLMTLQLLNPMQNLFVSRNNYSDYLSCDLNSEKTWDSIVETLVDNLFANQ